MDEKPGDLLTIEELAGLPEDTKIYALQARSGRQDPLPEDRPALAFPESCH